MPILACLMNLSMEFHTFFNFSYDSFYYLGNIIWFLLDLIILYQIIRFYPVKNKVQFYSLGIIGFIIWSVVIQISLIIQSWIIFSAFFQNLIMSLLFIDFLKRDDFPKGQSLYIALFRIIGTTSAVFVILTKDIFQILDLTTKILLLCIPICDIIYMYLFTIKKRKYKVCFEKKINI